MSINEITINEMKNFSLLDKILIIEKLWNSILESNQYPELTKAQAFELNRRIDSFNANPEMGRN
jgi:putative addiction module component (TIGR02574 family)